MAQKRKRRKSTRSRKRRRSGTRGTRGMKGLKALGRPLTTKGPVRDITPAVTGAVVTGVTTLGLRAYLEPVSGSPHAAVYKQAPLIGIGAGALASLAMYMLGGGGPATSTLLTSLFSGGLLYGSERLNASKHGAYMALAGDAVTDVVRAGGEEGAAGVGAILPEYAGTRGMNAVVMERGAQGVGKMGQEVALQGMGGTVDESAFGKGSFN